MTEGRGAKSRSHAGFTLVEIMISLAILSLGLTVLISSVGNNVRASQQAFYTGVATDLARAKMYDIEEELLRKLADANGGKFPDTNEVDTGDFSDDGWPNIRWKSEIEKVEMPGINSLASLLGGEGGEEGEEGGEGGEGAGGSDSGGFGGLLGMIGGGGAPGSGGDLKGVAEGALISSQMELLTSILESSIRRVRVTVSWKVGGYDRSMDVICYFTDPTAVTRTISGVGL